VFHLAHDISELDLSAAFLTVCTDTAHHDIACVCLAVRLSAELASGFLLCVVLSFVVEWQIVINVKYDTSIELCLIVFLVKGTILFVNVLDLAEYLFL